MITNNVLFLQAVQMSQQYTNPADIVLTQVYHLRLQLLVPRRELQVPMRTLNVPREEIEPRNNVHVYGT